MLMRLHCTNHHSKLFRLLMLIRVCTWHLMDMIVVYMHGCMICSSLILHQPLPLRYNHQGIPVFGFVCKNIHQDTVRIFRGCCHLYVLNDNTPIHIVLQSCSYKRSLSRKYCLMCCKCNCPMCRIQSLGDTVFPPTPNHRHNVRPNSLLLCWGTTKNRRHNPNKQFLYIRLHN